MDSHRSEDRELQKKIKQVMEITRASEDEACMALHSREYDTAQAITLLTDESGQLLSSEWTQAGKKKKTKTPGSKADGPATDKQRGTGKEGRGERSDKRDPRGDRPERDSKDTEADGQTTTGNEQTRREDRGNRSDRGGDRDNRGRGSRRGGRGRGSGRADNKENDEVSGSRSGYVGGFGGRLTNGPGRGRGGGGIGRGLGRGLGRDGRTFASRTRGRDEDSSYHPIDVWENSQADTPAEKPPLKVDKWDEFPSAEDWDNEEYTGSLQETKVFTPSTQTQVAPPLGDTTNGGPNHLGNSVSPGLVGDVKISAVGSGDALGDSSVVVGPTGPVVPGQSIDLSLLLQKPPNSSNVSNAGANLLATLQSSYSNSNQVQMNNANQPLPPRHKVQRPRGPTTKIPSSAVEMPVDAVTNLDVQFGGLEFDDNSSMSFNSVMHGGSTKSNAEILYGRSPPTKIDSFSAAEKESLGPQSEPPAPSPFQNQRNSQSSIVETVSSATVPISPNIDSHSLTLQNQVKSSNPPQSSYGNSANVVSAFVSYGKGAPGFPAAPGFAPVAQPPPGVSYSSSNSPGGGAVTATSYSNSQTSYHNNMGSLSYGNQPVVSAVLQPSQIQSQPIIASASQSTYSGTSQTPAYHHNANAVYGNNTTGTNQYGAYGQKLQNALSAQNVTSGHQQTVKDSSSESNSSVPASGSSSANSVQMGSLQGSVIVSTSSSNPKISSSSNVPTSAAAKMGIPPGMMTMQPQYILNQSGVPAFYSIQPQFYGFDENMQILPRIPAHLQGYYDPAANYGNPMSFALEAAANAGVQGGPGVSTRNDGTTLPSFSGGSDARFPRSDSSTASPVQHQSMYPGGYYFVGNNMMHAGTHFPAYAPPHIQQPYLTTAVPAPTNASGPHAAMATPTNASGAPHAATANHQYQSKGVYNPSYSYEAPQGPSTDFSKNSYAGGPGVGGPNSNSGKSASSTPSGTSQTTDLNTSMYSKGHLKNITSYEKPYVNSGGYNTLGAGANPLNSQMSGAGMGTPYGVYIAQQPVQPLPLPQDGSNVRQGTGQPKGNKQQYGTGPYWSN